MKTKITIIFLILTAALVVFIFNKDTFLKSSTDASKPATKLSEDYLTDISKLSLRAYKGDALSLSVSSLKETDRFVVHFWASWCAPCVNEVPELIEYSKSKPNVKFLIVSVDDYQEDIEKFLKSFPDFNSDKYIKIWDGDKKMSKLFNVDRLPMSIVFDKSQSEPKFYRSVVDWKSLD